MTGTRLLSETGPEKTTITTDGQRLLWRQVGHHGQTGTFYALDETPSNTEPGGWAPLWVLVDVDPISVPDPEDITRAQLAALFRIATEPVYVFRSRWAIGPSITPQTLIRLESERLITVGDHEAGHGRRLTITDTGRATLHAAINTPA